MTNRLELAVKYFINELQPDALKLQKLLYFTQGISFYINGKEFFEEECEAWTHGPVVPEVYHEYKGFQSNPICINYSIPEMNAADKLILERVRDNYGKHESKYLAEMTHTQEPWINARHGLSFDERGNEIMSKESIGKYFTETVFQQTGQIAERLWLNEVIMKYPMKWIVAVNCGYDEEHKMFGTVRLVTDDWETAHQVSANLIDAGNNGKVACLEGYDSRPQIGGLTLCH